MIGFSDPVFCKKVGIEVCRDWEEVMKLPEGERKRVAREWLGEVNSGIFRNWDVSFSFHSGFSSLFSPFFFFFFLTACSVDTDLFFFAFLNRISPLSESIGADPFTSKVSRTHTTPTSPSPTRSPYAV